MINLHSYSTFEIAVLYFAASVWRFSAHDIFAVVVNAVQKLHLIMKWPARSSWNVKTFPVLKRFTRRASELHSSTYKLTISRTMRYAGQMAMVSFVGDEMITDLSSVNWSRSPQMQWPLRSRKGTGYRLYWSRKWHYYYQASCFKFEVLKSI